MTGNRVNPLRLLFVIAVVGIPAVAGAQATAKEPAYPSKPIRLVVTFAPGGTTDIQERSAAMGSVITGGTPEWFQEYLKSELAKYGKLVKQAGP